jgi:multisubunit Na+/H+ antiporter MnhF subunit
MQYMGVALVIVCAGLAYEEDFYTAGAIIIALISSIDIIRDVYEGAE